MSVREGDKVPCPACKGTGGQVTHTFPDGRELRHCDRCWGRKELVVAFVPQDEPIGVGFNAYQLHNLRWLFRQAARVSSRAFVIAQAAAGRNSLPTDIWELHRLLQFDTGDWFGEVSTRLVAASRIHEKLMVGGGPNVSEGDGSSPWDPWPK